jgi:hypothetical protein
VPGEGARHVIDNFDGMMIGRLATGPAIDDHQSTMLGATLDEPQGSAAPTAGRRAELRRQSRCTFHAPVHVNGH